LLARILRARQRRQHRVVHRCFPRRAAEILAGGSIYWVVAGWLQVRQRILDQFLESAAAGVAKGAEVVIPAAGVVMVLVADAGIHEAGPRDGPKAPRVFRVEASSPSQQPPLPAVAAVAAVPAALPPCAPTPPVARKVRGLAAEMTRLDQTIDEIRAAQAFSLNRVVPDSAWRALSERALKLRYQVEAIRAKPSRGPF
jgi:hypothetical protein